LPTTVFVREFLPQDRKIQVERLTNGEVTRWPGFKRRDLLAGHERGYLDHCDESSRWLPFRAAQAYNFPWFATFRTP